jgi:hypothetical protein
MKSFQVAVFGKQGCDKCRVLKNRMKKLLAEEAYSDFELIYYDLGTVEGLVRFSQCEVLNPQRIPGFLIFEQGEKPGGIILKPLSRVEGKYDSYDENMGSYLGLETDYSSSGILTPKMLREVLDKALNSQEVKIQVL